MVDDILMTLSVAAGVSLLINLPAMIRGVTELLTWQPLENYRSVVSDAPETNGDFSG
ncbi:MAG: hypothetical protein HQ518_03165 [Rhodopirellula sp.]|nr:hypothetical protein [Rhodopirellula sp.]